MKLQALCASFIVSQAMLAQTSTPKPVVIKTPCDYQILDTSGNGKWACGAYVDASQNTYGFLWNLETNDIELLDPTVTSIAHGVSDDGVVVGEYSDENFSGNGASVSLAGYWANHKWNRMELPSGSVSYGRAASISPDGKYATGAVTVNGKYYGYIWENGKIKKQLTLTSSACFPYAISPDGQLAGGWMYSTKNNRRACIWETNGDVTWLTDQVSPWSFVRTFSPDGSKALYYGGAEEIDGKTGVKSIYDVATKTKTPVFELSTAGQFLLFDVSNKGTVAGANANRGYLWKDGKAIWADEYLKEQGVDLAAEHVVTMPDTDYPCIYRASSVSADDNVMGFLFYNDDVDESGNLASGQQSMIVKFNEQSSGLSPLDVKASQVSGMKSVMISWTDNVAAQGISGYNVYRDDKKINTALVTDKAYVDAAPGDGEHKYTVSAVYGTEESAKSEVAVLTVADWKVSAPSALFTQQRGYNNAYLNWVTPTTNFSSLTYFDSDNAKMEGFGRASSGVSFETAIKFDAVKLSAFKGQKIRSVGFYPLSEQGSWKINLYTHDAEGKLQLLYSQPVSQQLVYGVRNDVKLSEPQNMPDGELLVAVEVNVTTASQNIIGENLGHTTEGASDLVRENGTGDFYSIGEYFRGFSYLYPVTWAIDATVAPEGADVNLDNIDHYVVYSDGSSVGTTKDLSFVVPALAQGEHTLGVKAVYADGRESEVKTASIVVNPNEEMLKAVDDVAVSANGNTAVRATWSVPVDKDAQKLQYSSDVASSTAVKGSAAYNYGFMAGALYSSDALKKHDGYVISSARFYPLSDAVFTVYLYKDDNLVDQVDVENYTKNVWNTVKFNKQITVDSKSTYKLVVDCYDVTPETAPLAVDNAPFIDGYSNLYSYDNESWGTLYTSESSISGNWLIGLNIENPNAMELPVAGYDVNIDGEKKNSDMVKENSYDYDFGAEDSKEHQISVDVYYTVKAESVKGGVTRFYIGSAGIGENTIERIEVRQGDNELTVTGNNVSSVELVSASGAVVASSRSNTVSLNGITSGVYVVRTVVGGNVVTKKIQIAK